MALNTPSKSCALRVSQSIPAIDNQAASGIAFVNTARTVVQAIRQLGWFSQNLSPTA